MEENRGPIIFLIVMLILCSFIIITNSNRHCVSKKEISEIGGCDGSGCCTVRFTDGSIGRSCDAIAGNKVCMEMSKWPHK